MKNATHELSSNTTTNYSQRLGTNIRYNTNVRVTGIQHLPFKLFDFTNFQNESILNILSILQHIYMPHLPFKNV